MNMHYAWRNFFSSSLYKIENSQEDVEKKCSTFDADHTVYLENDYQI